MTAWTWYLSQPRGLTDATDTLTDDGLMTADGDHPSQSHLSFSGQLTTLHIIPRSLSGTQATQGTLSKALIRTLTGSVSWSGALARRVSYVRQTSGTLFPTGDLTYVVQYRRTLAGTVSFAGLVSRLLQYRRTLTSALTFTGTVSGKKAFLRTVLGTLSFSGLLRKLFLPLLDRYLGSVPFSGSQIRTTFKRLSAPPALTDAATILTDDSVVLADGYLPGTTILQFAGSLLKTKPVQVGQGAISFSGQLSSKYHKYEAPAETHYYWPVFSPDSTEYRISIRRRR